MLIYSEPGISSDNLNKMGQQLAHLFKQVGLHYHYNRNYCCFSQDVQLWDVKAKQLKSWVDRGLLNVKLLDRTLAYFQNQSSYLQYIRTSAANRLTGEVVQSRRRPLLGPSPG